MSEFSDTWLALLQAALTDVVMRVNLMAVDLTALREAVARNSDLVQQAIDAINAGGSGDTVDPAELQALADQVGADDDALQQALDNPPAAAVARAPQQHPQPHAKQHPGSHQPAGGKATPPRQPGQKA